MKYEKILVFLVLSAMCLFQPVAAFAAQWTFILTHSDEEGNDLGRVAEGTEIEIVNLADRCIVTSTTVGPDGVVTVDDDGPGTWRGIRHRPEGDEWQWGAGEVGDPTIDISVEGGNNQWDRISSGDRFLHLLQSFQTEVRELNCSGPKHRPSFMGSE